MMKQLKSLFFLMVCMCVISVHVQAKGKQDPLLQKPFLILPYFDAFGMKVWELDSIEEVSRGSISTFYHQIVRDYTFVDKKENETSIKYEYEERYSTGESGINHIMYHISRIFPTFQDVGGFIMDEIPTEWEEISEEEFYKLFANRYGFHSPDAAMYTNITKHYKLPEVKGKPAIYAAVSVGVWPDKKKKVHAVGSIHYRQYVNKE